MTATPLFDDLMMDWIESGRPPLFSVRRIAEVTTEGEQAKLADTLGTLPMYEDFESSFDGEVLDFSPEYRGVITEHVISGPDDMPVVVHHVQSYVMPDDPDIDELKGTLARVFVSDDDIQRCLYYFNEDEFFDPLKRSEMVKVWQEALGYFTVVGRLADVTVAEVVFWIKSLITDDGAPEKQEFTISAEPEPKVPSLVNKAQHKED